MKKVLLRGPLLSLSGYGIHSRQIFEWLETVDDIQLYVDIVKWGMTSWIIDNQQEGGIVGRIMNCSKDIKDIKFDISIQVQLPDEWDPNIAKKNIGVSAVVETNICSRKWVECCNRMDMIIVPSTFTRSVLRASGDLTSPVHVIPEWFNKNIKKTKSKKMSTDVENIKLSAKFNFLLIGTITSQNPDDDRKNILYSLKWLMEEFKDNKKVGIVIKTSFGRGTKIDKEMTANTLENAINEIRSLTKSNFPKVTLIHGNMTQQEVADLYSHKKIKCFVSCTKGEGYGLPLIEAAASGMPVVATGWSGHRDFLKEKYLSVDYTLKTINNSKIDGRVFVKNAKWAHVSENSFKRNIKEVYNNYQKHKKNANALQDIVIRDFSKNSVIGMYNGLLNEKVFNNG